MCLHVCVSMCESVCTCVFVCLNVCACLCVCMCVYVYVCVYFVGVKCMYLCIYVCMYVCVHVCMCVWSCVWSCVCVGVVGVVWAWLQRESSGRTYGGPGYLHTQAACCPLTKHRHHCSKGRGESSLPHTHTHIHTHTHTNTNTHTHPKGPMRSCYEANRCLFSPAQPCPSQPVYTVVDRGSITGNLTWIDVKPVYEVMSGRGLVCPAPSAKRAL